MNNNSDMKITWYTTRCYSYEIAHVKNNFWSTICVDSKSTC